MPNPYQSSVYGQPFVNKSAYPGYPTAQTQGSGGQPVAIPKPIPGGGYYGSVTQPHLYHGYDEIAGTGALTHIPQEYKIPVVPSQASMHGIPQQFPGFGLNGVAPQAKQGGQPVGSQAGGVDFKSQSNNRQSRQVYEQHKYQTQSSSGGGSSAQTNQVAGTNNNSGQGQMTNVGGNVGAAIPYYSQQHFGATGVAGGVGGYQPQQMMHSYGGQGGVGLYGQNAAVLAAQQAAVAAARQGGPYWANQG
ncbi:hypothetical protein HK096_001902 [Nowakowskiella sp. JEL0078]|nr:hypothetical protein HK096_001902 [Nowakowskiella sp. JEL0078]